MPSNVMSMHFVMDIMEGPVMMLSQFETLNSLASNRIHHYSSFRHSINGDGRIVCCREVPGNSLGCHFDHKTN